MMDLSWEHSWPNHGAYRDAYGTHVMISVRIGHHIPHSEGKRSVLFPLSGANREELKASERFSAATPSSPSARERRWFGLKPRLSSLDGRGGMATATATAGDEAACAAISGFAWRTRTAIRYGSSLWGAATLQGIGAASFRIKLLDQTKKKICTKLKIRIFSIRLPQHERSLQQTFN